MHRVWIHLQCGMQQTGCTKPHPHLQRARELHPDLRNNVHHAAFVTLLQAYEVRGSRLSDKVLGSSQISTAPNQPCYGTHAPSCFFALQVLSDDHKRQLYDLSSNSQAGRFAKEAAQGKETFRCAPMPCDRGPPCMLKRCDKVPHLKRSYALK